MDVTCYNGIHAGLTDRIIRAAIEVHKELGCGLKEEAYEATLAWELEQRGMKVVRQVQCPAIYKGLVFCSEDDHPKRIDLLVEDKIVVELKATPTNNPVFAAQCRTYLRMPNLPIGLVLNSGFPTMREGLQHVENPKALPPNLQTSERRSFGGMGNAETRNKSTRDSTSGEIKRGKMELLHIVTKAVPRENLSIDVSFDTGEQGVFDCAYLAKDPYWSRLNDPEFFNTARAEYGTIVWDDNIDVAPESVWERSVKSNSATSDRRRKMNSRKTTKKVARAAWEGCE